VGSKGQASSRLQPWRELPLCKTMKDKIIIKAAGENSYNCSESSEFTAVDNYIISHDKIILSITKMNPGGESYLLSIIEMNNLFK
jgi:hypothetical protein